MGIHKIREKEIITKIMDKQTKRNSPLSGETDYEKRGYLNSDFKLFHLTDIPAEEFEFHYHDFDKIIIFLSGHVDYTIEGRTYRLMPYDIVLVNHGEIHRPAIDQSVPYDRIIVYLSPDFLNSYQTQDYDLSECFRCAAKAHSNVLRMGAAEADSLFLTIRLLEKASTEEAYANDLYCQVLFLEFLIHLNRTALSHRQNYFAASHFNPKIVEITDFINQHLSWDLNVDLISRTFFLSKYHLMRLFKQETGYTIGGYINCKRLLMAKQLLLEEESITHICYLCGFKNYSTFFRAYRKFFHEAPHETKHSNTL